MVGDAPGADLGRLEGLGAAVPALPPLLAGGAELLGFASLAVEESGPGAEDLARVALAPLFSGKGMVWLQEQPRALAGLPFPSFPGGFSAPLDLLDGSARAGRDASGSVDDLACRRVLAAMLCWLSRLLTWKMQLCWRW